MTGSPVEHALSHLLLGAPDAALRWGVAALESEPSSPAALVVTARALARLGRKRAAIDGLFAAARRAAVAGDAPMALAAIAELRALEVDGEKLLAEVAAIVCREPTPDLQGEETTAWGGSIQPVSPLLTRHELAARATELIYEAAGTECPRPDRSAFLGSLSAAAFRELARAFRAIMVPAGYRAIEEGGALRDVFVIASGEVEVSRRGGRVEARSLATLGSGALFGEMSMLARLPAATSVLTTRPTILLVAPRTTLEAISARHKDLRLELGAHCRRQAIGNLGAACAVMTAVPARSRGSLVDRMVCRLYARGDRLVHAGEEVAGLHLILAGDVALVGRDGGDERIVLSTLSAGDVVGEAEVVLCRRADTEAIALGPGAALFLPRDEYFALALDHPAIVYGLYTAAVRRLGETGEALQSGASDVADTDVQLDELAPALEVIEAETASDELLVSLAAGGGPRSEPVTTELESVVNAEPPPEPPPPEPEPTVTLPPASMAAEIARARPPSSPPPAMDAPVLAPEPTPSTAIASASPSTLAPVAAGASALPPRPSAPIAAPRSSFGRRSVQWAALVVVAASVAAVLATHEDRPSALNLSDRGSPVMEEPASRSVATVPAAAAQAPPTAPGGTATGPAEARTPAPGAAAPATPAPGSAAAPPPIKAAPTSSPRKRSAKPAGPSESPSPVDESPAPAASTAPDRPAATASAAPVPKPAPAPSAAPPARASTDSPFGGRE